MVKCKNLMLKDTENIVKMGTKQRFYDINKLVQ